MQQLLLDLFSKILTNDEKMLARISAFEGDVTFDTDDAVFVFSLRALHEFLSREIDVDYKIFKSLVYQGNLNEELLKLGGRIEIHESSGKVDSSFYRLVKIT